MNRELWLAVTSDDARHKAFNFLKLIKPPDGTEMTDQVIKLDWNKDTSDRWTVNDAKTSMLDAGYDWEKRDAGRPLSEDNFRVVYATSGPELIPSLSPYLIDVRAGEPVRHFELLEEWMGPALGTAEPNVRRDGVFYVEWPVGSIYDQWPSEGNPGTFNTITWINVVAIPPISDSEFWFRTMVQKVKDTAADNSKVSQNGNGNSVWYQWTSTQDPDLGGDEIWLFRSNADGGAEPLRRRQAWAI